MKKVFPLLLAILLLSGCAAPKLASSVWCTLDSATNGNEEGLMVESIYFLNDGKAEICRSIITESGLEVAPYKYANANYSVQGPLNKEAGISFNAFTIKGDSLSTQGIINVKKNTLILKENSDKPATVYYKNPNVIIK